MMTSEPAAPPLMKHILGPQALAAIADAGRQASPDFDHNAFLTAASEGLAHLSIMERVRHIADALKLALPLDYPTALKVVCAMAPMLAPGFQVVAITEFVARHGLDHFGLSLDALADLTRFGSAELRSGPSSRKTPSEQLP